MSAEITGDMSGLEELAHRRGWTVEYEDSSGVLVDVVDKGLFGCMDDRADGADQLIEHPGPKMQGGLYGLAAMMGNVTKEGLAIAAEAIRRLGFTPGAHGNCGWEKLARGGELPGVQPLEYTPEEVPDILSELGAEYPQLGGPHTARRLRVNRRQGTTGNPAGEAFHLDIWTAPELGLSPEQVVGNAFDTIEGLDGPRIVSFLD